MWRTIIRNVLKEIVHHFALGAQRPLSRSAAKGFVTKLQLAYLKISKARQDFSFYLASLTYMLPIARSLVPRWRCYSCVVSWLFSQWAWRLFSFPRVAIESLFRFLQLLRYFCSCIKFSVLLIKLIHLFMLFFLLHVLDTGLFLPKAELCTISFSTFPILVLHIIMT